MKLLNKVYARILRVLTNSSLNFNSNNKSPLSYIISDEKNSTFFGYHDKIPFSQDGKKLLALSYEEENKQINVGFLALTIIKKNFSTLKKYLLQIVGQRSKVTCSCGILMTPMIQLFIITT